MGSVGNIAALSPGRRVTDAIRLVKKLGQGGMGTVWLAHHASLRADVVVKFLAPELVGDPTSAARFANEAAAIAQVRSPHIVQVLDHGRLEGKTGETGAGGPPFIVMELLEGEDLQARLRRETKLSPPETARIVAAVARALDRAHARGIVHRDIKPANVFLCHDGGHEPFVKVLDFGVAKVEALAGDLKTESGALVGTPTYMSPEQLVGSAVDHRADLWALGALAFRAMTGVPPYRGESIGALALEIHGGATPSACALDPSIPAAVDAWIARALERDPARRFQSALEMGDALLAATRLDPAVPAPRPPKRGRLLVPGVLALALALAIASAGAVVATLSRRPPVAPPERPAALAPTPSTSSEPTTSIEPISPPVATPAKSEASGSARAPHPPRPKPAALPSSVRERDIE